MMATEIGAAPQTMQVVGAASAYWWAVPLFIFLGTTAASILSKLAINTQRSIARTRATLDLIERSESQPYYRELYMTFQAVRRDERGFDQLKNPTNPMLQKQRQDVVAFLNHYELIALGCHKGVLDAEFYKLWMRSAFVRDCEAAWSFILSVRAGRPDLPGGGNPKAFILFEELAVKWGANLQEPLPLPETEN